MTWTYTFRRLGAFWGVLGVCLLLGFAIIRLLPFAAALIDFNLATWQLVVLTGWCFFMLYTEGYKAFGQQFAPRVVARAQYLARSGARRELVLAPLFCVGYFRASKKRIITAYALMAGIITLIALVHFVAQPWRGIIDAGVILGLAYGIGSVVLNVYRACRQPGRYVADPEVVGSST